MTTTNETSSDPSTVMPAEVETRDDDKTVDTRSSIDTRTTVDARRLDSEFVQMHQEFQEHEYKFTQGRAQLEERFRDHFSTHQAKTEQFQGRMAALLDKAATQEEKYNAKIKKLTTIWEEQFRNFEARALQSLDAERHARTKALDELKTDLQTKAHQMEILEDKLTKQDVYVTELSNQLASKDKRIDELQTKLALQAADIDAAHTERESMQQELKNILVTLHFQFEALNDELSKKESSIKAVSDRHKYIEANLDQKVEEVTTYVDELQYELSQVQLEAKAVAKQTEDEQTAARQELEQRLQESVENKYEELESYMNRVDTRIEKVSDEVRNATDDQNDTIQAFMDQSEQKLDDFQHEMDARLEELQEENQADIQEIREELQEDLDDAAKTTENKHRELKIALNSNIDLAKTSADEVQQLMQKASDLRQGARTIEMDFLSKLDGVNERLDKQKTHLVTIKEDIVGMQDDLESKIDQTQFMLIDTEKKLQDKLSDHSDRIFGLAEKHTEHREELDSTGESLEKAHGRISDMMRQIGAQDNQLDSMNNRLEEDSEKTAKAREELSGRIDSLGSEFHTFAANDRQKRESQILANKAFATKQEDFDIKVREFRSDVSGLAGRVERQATKLLHITSPESVAMMVKPWTEKQENLDFKVRTQATDMVSLQKDVQGFTEAQASMDRKIDSFKTTSESLFQHLAADIKQETTDLKASKEANLRALNELRKQFKNWEEQMIAWQEKYEKLTLEQASVQTDVKATVDAQKLGLDSLYESIDKWREELNTTMDTVKMYEKTHHSIEGKIDSAQQASQQILSEEVEKIWKWKGELEKTLNEKTKCLTENFETQQQAADKQAAKIVMRVTKKEVDTFKSDFQSKLDDCTSKLENFMNRAQEEANNLQRDVVGLKMTRGLDGQTDLCVADLEAQIQEWNTKINALEGRLNEQSAELQEKSKRLGDVEGQLDETSKLLVHSRYECRGLRVQLSGAGKNKDATTAKKKVTFDDEQQTVQADLNDS